MNNPITPLTPEQITEQEAKVSKEGYIQKDLVGLDQFANVLLGGSPDETISSRVARWDTEDKGIKHEVGKIVSKGLDLFQPDHGAKAEAGDLERSNAIQAIETEALGTE